MVLPLIKLKQELLSLERNLYNFHAKEYIFTLNTTRNPGGRLDLKNLRL